MKFTVRSLVQAAAIASVLSAGGTACAEGLLGGSVSGQVVVGPIVASGERSWMDEGLGKLSRGDDTLGLTADAILAWRTQFSNRIGAVVTGEIGADSDPRVGLGEAYMTLRPALGAPWRVSGRVGVFFPPFSLEHDGTEWSVIRTLTPSAINTWVAEEVKTTGMETTLRGLVLNQPVGVTIAGFQANDTSGALLAFRGWSLHDQRALVGGTHPLPNVPAMFAGSQAERTQPIDEIDDRWGGYARVEWEALDSLTVSLSGYDNNGDETSLDDGQYAWRTRFIQLAGSWSPTDDMEVLAQVMNGETRMGPVLDGKSPADVGYISAYALASQDFKRGMASGRIEYFAVSDRSFKTLDNNAERGWSMTAAWSQTLSMRTHLVLEGIFVDSDRPDRLRFGEERSQQSVQGRIALRAAF